MIFDRKNLDNDKLVTFYKSLLWPRMIEEKILPARQVVPCAPWEIPVEVLDSEAIRKEATHIKNRMRVPRSQSIEGQQSMFSER